MNLFRHIEADYRRLARDGLPDQWRIDAATLDDAVDAIRDHRQNQERSDDLTRRLATIARTDQRAAVVVLHALAPLLGARLGRAVTAEYRTDALTELAMVILDSPLDGPRLAHRLVNRAHTRVYKAARRVEHRGVVHIVEIVPVDPTRMMASMAIGTPDISHPLFRLKKENWRHIKPNEHLYYFQRSNLEMLLRKTGFKPVLPPLWGGRHCDGFSKASICEALHRIVNLRDVITVYGVKESV